MSDLPVPHFDPDAALLPPLRDPLFDGLRDELAGLDTPPGVRKELLAAFARQRTALPWWRRLGTPGWRLAGGGAALATVLVTVLIAALYQAGAPASPTVYKAAGRGDFVALEPLERIEQDPAPTLLSTTVPRAALTALGVAVDPQDAGDMMQAEMLVGADGSPLALRLAVQ